MPLRQRELCARSMQRDCIFAIQSGAACSIEGSNKMEIDHIYFCPYVETKSDILWDRIEGVYLIDVVTGCNPQLKTLVKACWNESNVYFRFVCDDDYIVATMKNRDDPLYQEDVVEVFIDVNGSGESYKEIEISPNNIIFDAHITNDLQGHITIDKSWDAKHIKSSVQHVKDQLIYDIMIPNHNLEKFPTKGSVWKVNFYRIDEDSKGVRSYSAWSPTGKVNFHIPQAFRSIRFMR